MVCKKEGWESEGGFSHDRQQDKAEGEVFSRVYPSLLAIFQPCLDSPLRSAPCYILDILILLLWGNER